MRLKKLAALLAAMALAGVLALSLTGDVYKRQRQNCSQLS